MPPKKDNATENLENQLRSMILSNVTIQDSDTDHPPPRAGAHQQQPQQRSRGSLRPYSNNRGRPNQHNQRNPNRPPGPRYTGPPVAARGGLTANRGQARSYHSQAQPNLVNPAVNAPTGPAHPSLPFRPMAPPQRLPDQANPASNQRLSHEGGHPTSRVPPPRILQRPHQNQGFHRPPYQDHSPAGPNTRQYYPQNPWVNQHLESYQSQARYLETVISQAVPRVQILPTEVTQKGAFRIHLEAICQKALKEGYSGEIETISLIPFGSLVSGFATKDSDMDLAIVPTWKDPALAGVHLKKIDPAIPRLLEKAILDAGLGGRLLSRTRVPILKVCEKPSDELRAALLEERMKWEELPDEEKFPKTPPVEPAEPVLVTTAQTKGQQPQQGLASASESVEVDKRGSTNPTATDKSRQQVIDQVPSKNTGIDDLAVKAPGLDQQSSVEDGRADVQPAAFPQQTADTTEPKPRKERPWHREKLLGPLDFPKSGCGIQCDINFENPLGIHNTHLLRCYHLCDPRVQPMVLFVKAWAKRRKINSSYSGTLSSYGYVLMVLHYLVNIADPPVCPNLQLRWKSPTASQDFMREMHDTTIGGYSVRFWNNEAEIINAAMTGNITFNKQTLGELLRGFFFYFASTGAVNAHGQPLRTFHWVREVLSLRLPGGIQTKEEKGWTGAKSSMIHGREVRHRYLFAIEDPFELDHNVARTVQHRGIVAIRDEFRRAARILRDVGRGVQPEGGLLDEVVEEVHVFFDGVKEMVGLESAVGVDPTLGADVHGSATPTVVPTGEQSGVDAEVSVTNVDPKVEQTGGEQTGGEQTGGEQTGGEQTGGEQTGGEQTGGEQTGGEQTGGEQTGGEQTGGEQTGGEQTGGEQIGG